MTYLPAWEIFVVEFDTAHSEPSSEQGEQIRRIERMLDEGLSDLQAGRTVSRDEMRRQIDAMFAEHATRQPRPKRA